MPAPESQYVEPTRERWMVLSAAWSEHLWKHLALIPWSLNQDPYPGMCRLIKHGRN